MDTLKLKIIEEEQKKIDTLIQKTFDNATLDGIINIEKYIESPIKILWILKEINDTDGYNQREVFNDLVEQVQNTKSLSNSNRKYWWPTMDPIIYISFQILNGFLKWEDVDYIQDNYKMVEVLQQISYINIKKAPGGAVSNSDELNDAYNLGKEIIHKQIELINPDVIIGGNTLGYLIEDYKLSEFKVAGKNNINYAIKDDRLFINSYHPQYLSRQNENYKGEYINEIVNIVKEYKKPLTKAQKQVGKK
jgi:hypothetical protein